MTAKLKICVLREEDSFSPCVDYVLRLFARNSGFGVRFISPEEANAGALACEADQVILAYLAPEKLSLLEKLAAGAASHVVLIERSSFFGPNFLKTRALPAPADTLLEAATEGLASYLISKQERLFRVSLDLVAASFWFLTRYEEYLPFTPDAHGRFLCSHSAAPPQMYDRPLVNLWFGHLRRLLLELLGVTLEKSVFTQGETFALTHDVDLMRKYRGFRGVRRALSTVLRGKSPNPAGELRSASAVLAGLQRDPYDSFDTLFAMKEKLGATSTFFFQAAGQATPYDADYRLEDTQTRELLSRIKFCGDELALHPSYRSYKNASDISREMQALSRATGRKIAGSRQHYLRFSLPDTWRALSEAGLRYDSTLSFADHCGFRCGWSGCFHPFDVQKRQELPIIEIPLTVMDVTLSEYEKLSAEHSLERLASLLEASAVPGGAFVLLWHNILQDQNAFPGYWGSLEYFIFAGAGSARFVTLERLCNEFEKSLEKVTL